jgi:sulfoxide reductase heme-binding subunit YedZ
MRWWLRHGVVVAASAALFLAFLAARSGMNATHQWNRAWADLALVLLVAALAIGPLSRLWPPAGRLRPWRRELGVWCVAAAVLHVDTYAHEAFGQGAGRWLSGSWAPFVYGAAGPHAAEDWLRTAWAAGNWIGLAALAYGLVLALTSNDLSQRLLGKGWLRLQWHTHTFTALVVAHTFLFYALAYDGHAGVLEWGLFWGMVAALAGLQVPAFVASIRAKGGPGGDDGRG